MDQARRDPPQDATKPVQRAVLPRRPGRIALGNEPVALGLGHELLVVLFPDDVQTIAIGAHGGLLFVLRLAVGPVPNSLGMNPACACDPGAALHGGGNPSPSASRRPTTKVGGRW